MKLGRAAVPLGPVLSGLLLAIPFLAPSLGALAWFALVPWIDALQRRLREGGGARAGFAAGYAAGLAFFLVAVHWISRLSDVAISVPWLKYPAWLLAAAYLALFPGLTGALSMWIARRGGISMSVAFPLSLIVVEKLRGSGELGFPWFEPGYTQSGYLPVLQLASIGGITLLTAWVAFVNVLAWRALAGRERGVALAGLVLVIALPWLWGGRVLRNTPVASGTPVALVQGNIPGEIKWSGQHQVEILGTFLRLSAEAVADTPTPVLVIWPETATGSYLRRQPDQQIAVSRFAATTGVPVFTGYADYDFTPEGTARSFNSAAIFGPSGPGERYAKRHLVPFGERMPFQGLIPALGKLELGQAEWTPGERPVVFESAAGPFSCLICFESIFPDHTRRNVLRGARWIVNVTNDEWFGDSAALRQHAAMARVRAIENHVPLARCANTGLTQMIDPLGRVSAQAPAFRQAVLAGVVPPPGPPTLFTRAGDWPGILAAICFGVLALRSLLLGRAR